MFNKTAEYRLTLARLIVAPTLPKPQPSLCYPDRHRRTDKQVALSTVRFMAAMLIGVLVAIGAALKAGVR
jgi:hypothetical protein